MILALAILLMPAFTTPAHAAAESVRHLGVTYDVRADGVIEVTYELDWDFGAEGRRGIVFGITTGEPWDLDPTQEAR